MKEGQYPWLPLFVSDWLSSESVSCMSLAAQGAFIRLLCYQWQNGTIPDDEVRLAKLLIVTPADFSEVWPELIPVFPVVEEGRRQNKRLEIERAKRQGRTAAAKESAGRRWGDRTEDQGDKSKGQKKPAKKAKEPVGPNTPKPVDPDSPFAKVERVLSKVSERLNGSQVQRQDVVRYVRENSPINLLLQLFSEGQVVDMYVHAASTWNGGVSWAAVHSQRDSIIASMKRPAGQRRNSKEGVEDKYQRLREGEAA